MSVEPPRGWHGAQTNKLFKARQWLAWCEHRLRQTCPTSAPQADRIRHAGNGGEVPVVTPGQSFLVDGYDEQTRTVYEFHGCLWHGCPTCFPGRDKYSKINRDRTFQEMYESTLAKENILRREGYTLVVIWECQWDRKVKYDPTLQSFLSSLQLVEPLEPRDTFFGGWTNATTLYYRADSTIGEQVRNVDVTSLYPFINATGEYPVGHPNIITHPPTQIFLVSLAWPR